MLFNSIAFLLFFPIVSVLYFCIPISQLRVRNLFLLVASYYFYMNWEPAYALLLLTSTVITYIAARGIDSFKEKSWKKFCLVSSLILNFSILFVFKYFNFFTTNIEEALHVSGLGIDIPKFKLLLPVGISFYIFQAVGYSIDVYRGTIKVERDFTTYALFVSFFPQLVAGPIERAKNLLPQFHVSHRFNSDDFIEGIKQMVWGYFMKLCIAENVSTYVDAVFNYLPNHNGTSVLLATFFFTFQIFCDFGGYSLIAIGTARCLGFKLMQNFCHPYLACSPRDFWHRWHISLSSWFGDYVYIPLGGSRCSVFKHQRNLFLTMIISGVWHGANWTFVFWGAIHGILLCLNNLKRRFLGASNGKCMGVIERIFTFIMVMFCWIFFRANTLADAFEALRKIFFQPGLLFRSVGYPSIVLPVILIIILMLKEVKDEFFTTPIRFMHNENKIISILCTTLIIVIIILCASFEGGQFIYFQF